MFLKFLTILNSRLLNILTIRLEPLEASRFPLFGQASFQTVFAIRKEEEGRKQKKLICQSFFVLGRDNLIPK